MQVGRPGCARQPPWCRCGFPKEESSEHGISEVRKQARARKKQRKKMAPLTSSTAQQGHPPPTEGLRQSYSTESALENVTSIGDNSRSVPDQHCTVSFCSAPTHPKKRAGRLRSFLNRLRIGLPKASLDLLKVVKSFPPFVLLFRSSSTSSHLFVCHPSSLVPSQPLFLESYSRSGLH